MPKLIGLIVCFAVFQHVIPQNSQYRFEIKSAGEFDSFAGEPLTKTFSGVSSVKVLYLLEEKKMYYINSRRYPLHYNFCTDVFDKEPLEDFNRKNYADNPHRKYFLATLNFFRDADIYTLEFSPADKISQQSAEMIFAEVKETFFSPRLLLQLSNKNLLQYSNWSVPVIGTTELFSGQKIQVIQKGIAFGQLVAVDADSLRYLDDVRNCILLIRGNSNDIPLCRGIITTCFQTPLSHISILSQNRKTPLVALKEPDGNRCITKLLSKQVKLTVLQDTFLIQEDTTRSDVKPIEPKMNRLMVDTITRAIVPLEKLKLRHAPAYGAKAVNMAELKRVRYKGKRILSPEGAFAIPMHYYFRHLQIYGVDTLIQSLVSSYPVLNRNQVKKKLSEIRETIETGEPAKELVNEIKSKIKLSGIPGPYRFRSSSNAEDLEGFNGAGLYVSETGNSPKSIRKALKNVWASLWSERAFDERCNAGIDHSTVGMAILVHRSFPSEYANGVAITRNLYRDFEFGFVVNMQAGDQSLVKPEGEATCEQFISYFNSPDPFFNEKDAVEYLSFSSLNNYEPLLTKTEIFDLTQQLDRIKRRFYRKTRAWKKIPYKDFAVDVEFKTELKNNRKVFYFKQVRPF